MTREEAIRRIKAWNLDSDDMEVLTVVIPELAESEDERIRRTLVEYFGPKVQLDFVRGIPIQKIRDWLEKQKEQEFTHHEVDESLVEAVDHQMEDDGDVDDFVRKGIDDVVLKYAELGAKWQKEQKPAEWSEDLKNELAKKHLDGYIMGREDIMREMRDFLESHFNTQSGTSRRQRNEQH